MASTKLPSHQASRQTARALSFRPAGQKGGRTLPLSKQGAALGTYFREVRSELRKVIWPTRREAMNLTAVTLALSVVVGLFLGGVDFLFQEFFRLLLGILAGG